MSEIFDLTQDEYQKRVQVAIVPQEAHESGEIPPDAKLWLYTSGMVSFGRPEFEIRDVPALYLKGAAKRINFWAHYSLTGAEVLADQNLVEEGIVPLLLRTVESPDPFWRERGVRVLRLEAVAAALECSHCGGPGADEDDEGPFCDEHTAQA